MAGRVAAAVAFVALVAGGGALAVPPAQAGPADSEPQPEVFVEVKFDEELEVRGADENLSSRRGRTLQPVQAVLDRHGAAAVRPFVEGRQAQRLERAAARAEARIGDEVPDLTSWYTVVLPASADLDRAIADLRALPEVRYAEPVPEPPPPPQETDTPDFTSLQRYFRSAAENGIEADFSRQDPRLRGDGIKIVDLEYNWNPFHEDLQLDWSTDLGGERFVRIDNFGDDHGTAVFGVLVALDNHYGVTGGVPDAEMYGLSPVERFASGATSWRPGPALAFLAALEGDAGEPFLEPGDAVLLEQQGGQVIPNSDCPVSSGTCYSPLEWNVAVHEAIQVLTAMGVNVVATGGNGYNSTDHPAYTRDGLPWFRPENHSGSILVGAGNSTTRERLNFSNHGPRFDLQGWGHQIATTGYCSLYCDPDDHNVRYSQTFSGTSGAGPIVTTAVVAVQSYVKSTGQDPWTTEQIADLLKETGQPQGPNTADRHIGPLPDLRAALVSIEVDPPETAVLLDGQAPRPGSYVNPLVTLEADDGWGSGVARTEYRVDGGPWTTYEGPFQVTGQGLRTVYYRSVDHNGNLEETTAVVFMNRGRGQSSAA